MVCAFGFDGGFLPYCRSIVLVVSYEHFSILEIMLLNIRNQVLPTFFHV
jgi:hypothetical protein